MLVIARALATKPELLLIDEATTGLMPIIINEMEKVFKELNKMGKTILLVEEKLPFAFSLAERVYVIEKGKIVFEGKIKKLMKNRGVCLRYLGVTPGSKYVC